MSVLGDIQEEYKDKHMPPELFLAWMKSWLELDCALACKEMEFAKSEQEIKDIYKKHMSVIKQLEKELWKKE